jgi:dTDP-glucose pyrophosphorylase
MLVKEKAAEDQKWRKALVDITCTLQDVIRNLNDSALQVALVVEAEDRLVGTITDGDIRRGLLRGLELTSTVNTILHRDALVVPPQLGRDLVLRLMRANRIHQLPVVDEGRRVVGLHVLDELMAPPQLPNQMVIMAGGRGMRLRPHTEHCPKPLLPVAGKPMLEHIVERARDEGFTRLVIAIHYLGHMIEDHFGDGSRWGVDITYLSEETALGTVGALSLLEPRPTAPFLVTNGDILTDIHYGELLDFHAFHGATATMAVRPHEWRHPFGVVHTKGVDIVGFEEKPVVRSHVNAGIYALQPEALDVLGDAESCDMPTLFSRLQERGSRTIVFPMHEPWFDVGRPDDYLKANGDVDPAEGERGTLDV